MSGSFCRNPFFGMKSETLYRSRERFWGELPLKLMEAQGMRLHYPKIFFLKSIELKYI